MDSTSTPRMRKSISFHSGDTKIYCSKSSPLFIETYTREDTSGNKNPVWDNTPMCKMKISPTVNPDEHFTDIETGPIHFVPSKPRVFILEIYDCSKKWVLKYHIECINVSLCVLLHVFVMIIFEIYFYFNYVVVIEKAAFIQKINDYFNRAEKYEYPITVDTNSYNQWLNILYAEYMASKSAQDALLHKLLQKACEMGGAFGIALLVFCFLALYNRKQIRWKTIVAENVGMLGLLGFFEYLFFTDIIMHYNPISDAELEYIVAKKSYDALVKNGTTTY